MAVTRGELVDALAEHVAVTPLTPAEIEAILSLAGAAAHGTGDRTTAPLASFLAGVVAAGGADRVGAVEDVRRYVSERAPSD